MKTSLVTVFLLWKYVSVVAATVSEDTKLFNLGTVEGKSYFANLGMKNFTEAQSFCENRNMKLATITSDKQTKFLKSSYHPIHFNGWFWVNAKGGKIGSTFTWEETTKPVAIYERLSWGTWNGAENSANCLCYSSNNHESAYYFAHGCYQDHHTICEKVSVSTEMESSRGNAVESNIIELGSFGGRRYFGDKILRTWSDSDAFCKNEGLQLVKLTTETQRRFLMEASRKINYDGYFWVTTNSFHFQTGQSLQLCPAFRDYKFNRPCHHKLFAVCENLTETDVNSHDRQLMEVLDAFDGNSDATTEVFQTTAERLGATKENLQVTTDTFEETTTGNLEKTNTENSEDTLQSLESATEILIATTESLVAIKENFAATTESLEALKDNSSITTGNFHRTTETSGALEENSGVTTKYNISNRAEFEWQNGVQTTSTGSTTESGLNNRISRVERSKGDDTIASEQKYMGESFCNTLKINRNIQLCKSMISILIADESDGDDCISVKSTPSYSSEVIGKDVFDVMH